MHSCLPKMSETNLEMRTKLMPNFSAKYVYNKLSDFKKNPYYKYFNLLM